MHEFDVKVFLSKLYEIRQEMTVDKKYDEEFLLEIVEQMLELSHEPNLEKKLRDYKTGDTKLFSDMVYYAIIFLENNFMNKYK